LAGGSSTSGAADSASRSGLCEVQVMRWLIEYAMSIFECRWRKLVKEGSALIAVGSREAQMRIEVEEAEPNAQFATRLKELRSCN